MPAFPGNRCLFTTDRRHRQRIIGRGRPIKTLAKRRLRPDIGYRLVFCPVAKVLILMGFSCFALYGPGLFDCLCRRKREFQPRRLSSPAAATAGEWLPEPLQRRMPPPRQCPSCPPAMRRSTRANRCWRRTALADWSPWQGDAGDHLEYRPGPHPLRHGLRPGNFDAAPACMPRTTAGASKTDDLRFDDQRAPDLRWDTAGTDLVGRG